MPARQTAWSAGLSRRLEVNGVETHQCPEQSGPRPGTHRHRFGPRACPVPTFRPHLAGIVPERSGAEMVTSAGALRIRQQLHWGSASPAPSINADHFSARWTRYIDLTEGIDV